jgi:hypothetical protein
MEWTLAEFFAQAIEGQRLVEMLLDKSANCLHSVGFHVSAEGLGPATQACAISSLFGHFRSGKELNIPPAGTARRT